MSQHDRQKLLKNLKSEYRHIVLKYFSQENSLNQKIDNFVDKAFFADISVSRIVEIHMELMEEFSNQLKLEGRSEDILLDYRLTLIDVIAHLGEMYRRSIPRES
jgi:circadian clock protein KaiA